MNFVTVADKSAGDGISESDWDSFFRDNINNLMTPPTAKAYRRSNQSVPNNAITSVVFVTEEWDTDGMIDLVANSGRITVVTPGIYMVMARIVFAGNGTGYRTIHLVRYNAAGVAQNDIEFRQDSPGTVAGTVGGAFMFQCIATDYFRVEVFQNSGGALNLTEADHMVRWASR